MKERLQHHLSDVGESFDYLKLDIRNLSRYMAELEELIEGYRTFASAATLSIPDGRMMVQRLLKKTLKILGPPKAKDPSCALVPLTSPEKRAEDGARTYGKK